MDSQLFNPLVGSNIQTITNCHFNVQRQQRQDIYNWVDNILMGTNI